MQGCVAHANCPGDPRALPPVYRSGQRFSGQAEVCEPCLCLTCHSHWLLLTFQVKEASDNQNKEDRRIRLLVNNQNVRAKESVFWLPQVKFFHINILA